MTLIKHPVGELMFKKVNNTPCNFICHVGIFIQVLCWNNVMLNIRSCLMLDSYLTLFNSM